MARIPELDRLAIVDEHLGHYTQADAAPGGPILIVIGYGRPQLVIQRDQYHTLQELILQLESDLEVAIGDRDGLFGIGPDDDDGAWFRFKQYKALVQARLGARHVLSRTVPNLGRITPQNYLDILHRFIDHWERVNIALAPNPLTLGTFTLALLQTLHTNLMAKIAEIDTIQATLRVRRQEREQLFGDETEEMREETSIIARLTLYHAVIEATFPNQPLADSLPDIFPAGSPTSLPTFAFNWVAQAGNVVKLWYNPPSPALTDAVLVFLKEGATELTSAVTSTTPGSTPVHNFSGVTVIGELDELELRNGSGLTIAEGSRNTGLAEPT